MPVSPRDWDVLEGGAELVLLITLLLQGQAHSGPSAATGHVELDTPHSEKGYDFCVTMTRSRRLLRV